MESSRPYASNTWTAYPSLLASLPLEKERTLLEDAARAHYCGRYEDADEIFKDQLPDTKTFAVLTLQRADMLTSQG